MTREAVVIFNPMAGPVSLGGYVSQARRYWRQRGWRVAARATEWPGHAAVLAQQAAQDGCQMVLVAGGDGTVGQVAHGLAGSPTALAVLPVGTANAFAKLLNLTPPLQIGGLNVERICERLARGRIQLVDLGRAQSISLPPGGFCFVSWAGVGLDGYIVERMEPRPKWVKQVTGRHLGWTSYLFTAVPSAMQFTGVTARVVVDGYSVDGTFVLSLVSNSRLYGGGMVQLCPDSRLDDGQLDIWLFRGQMFGEALGHAIRLLAARHLTSEDTIHLRGRRVLIRPTESTEVELDGEPAGQAPLYVSVERQALHLLAPDSAPADLFSRPGQSFFEWERA